MDPPESLEKIFQRVEEESERRAQTDSLLDSPAGVVRARSPITASSEAQKAKSRRRGSVSISRLGQLDDLSKNELVTSKPSTPTILTALASQSTFYQPHINGSQDSLASEQPSDEGAHMHAEDNDHVTQVHRIAARQTISRAVGSLLPRRLSRARSRPVIAEGDGNMVIGVSVQAATATTTAEVSGEPETPSATATVFAPGTLKPKASKSSLRSLTSSSDNWVTKAKDFTKRFRRKSKLVLNEPEPVA